MRIIDDELCVECRGWGFWTVNEEMMEEGLFECEGTTEGPFNTPCRTRSGRGGRKEERKSGKRAASIRYWRWRGGNLLGQGGQSGGLSLLCIWVM